MNKCNQGKRGKACAYPVDITYSCKGIFQWQQDFFQSLGLRAWGKAIDCSSDSGRNSLITICGHIVIKYKNRIPQYLRRFDLGRIGQAIEHSDNVHVLDYFERNDNSCPLIFGGRAMSFSFQWDDNRTAIIGIHVPVITNEQEHFRRQHIPIKFLYSTLKYHDDT